MKKIVTAICILVGYFANAQTYNPSNFTVSNKSYGVAQAVSTDARSWFYDAGNFVMRDYRDTTEVNNYLNLAKYRSGHFPIFVHFGGTLNGNGTYTGGTTQVWWYKDSTARDNIVRWYTDSVATTGVFFAIANNLSEGNPTTIKTNLSLQNVNNTSDATKNAAAVSLTNHTIDGSLNTLLNIGNSSLTNSTIGLTVGTTGTDIAITGTPASLGGSLNINVPTASASNRGALSIADWIKFTAKVDSTTRSHDTVFDWHSGSALARYTVATTSQFANNGVYRNGDTVQLGRPVGGTGASFTHNSEINMSTFSLNLFDSISGSSATYTPSSTRAVLNLNTGGSVGTISQFAIGQLLLTGTQPFATLIGASNTSTANSGTVTMRARGTLAFPLAVQSGDYVMSHIAAGFDGTNRNTSASFDAYVDSAVSLNSVPIGVGLATGTSGGTRTMRLTVDRNGHVGIGNTGYGSVPTNTASLHITRAATGGAGTGPFKLTAGTNLSVAETGLFEYDGTLLYFTPSLTRLNFILNNYGISGGQTIVGSTSTTSGLTLKATSGVGTTNADIVFQTGNNGATEAMRIFNDGSVRLGNVTTGLDSDSGLVKRSDGKIYKVFQPTSGLYTPTLTNTTNITGASLTYGFYVVVDSIVNVTIGGGFTTIVANNTPSVLTFTLPFATSNTLQGAIGSGSVAQNAGSAAYVGGIVDIAVNSTTGTFSFYPTAGAGTSANFSFSFKYRL